MVNVGEYTSPMDPMGLNLLNLDLFVRWLVSTNGKMVVWWFGIRIGMPLSNNPFHMGIAGIQTSNPNHQFTIN